MLTVCGGDRRRRPALSEPESLDTDEALDRRVARHMFDRLIMLCDGTYAIAITLAALEIHLPEGAPTLSDAWLAVQTQVLSYFVSFAVIANFWFSNRDLFARLHRVDAWMTRIVLTGLCMVALIPASTHLVYSQNVNSASRQGYALTMVLAGALNLAGWIYASVRPGLMIEGVPRVYRWQRMAAAATVPVLFSVMLVSPGLMGLGFVGAAMVVMIAIRRRLIPRLFG